MLRALAFVRSAFPADKRPAVVEIAFPEIEIPFGTVPLIRPHHEAAAHEVVLVVDPLARHVRREVRTGFDAGEPILLPGPPKGHPVLTALRARLRRTIFALPRFVTVPSVVPAAVAQEVSVGVVAEGFRSLWQEAVAGHGFERHSEDIRRFHRDLLISGRRCVWEVQEAIKMFILTARNLVVDRNLMPAVGHPENIHRPPELRGWCTG